MTVDDRIVQAASERFRREHGLQSVEATEAWLGARGVTLDCFGDYLERSVLEEHFNGEGQVLRATEHPDTTAIADLVWPEMVFSGVADAVSRALASMVAVAEASDAHPKVQGPESLSAYDAAYQAFARSVLTEARMEAALRSRWGELFTLDCELALFGDEDTAREAALCVSEDGADLASIGASGGGRYQGGRLLLRELPAVLRTRAMAAAPGEVLPVQPLETGFVVCRIRDKEAPSLADEATRTFVREAALEEEVTPLVARHIEWLAVP
jgi:hypothetical protein